MSARSATPAEAEPIPISVLTGFLGAGKTSLLNRLIGDPALAETAVIINEFGEIGLSSIPSSKGRCKICAGGSTRSIRQPRCWTPARSTRPL